mmetsp:Transcript_81084/g.247764  ORF Transcript_81084/g.247764 Transcript_81084/m.247764 type:complete len:538 (-) Transcript_81084:364-1977(-)
MTTRMPAPRASATDSGTPSRSGSIEATRPMSRSPVRHAWNFSSVVTSSSSVSKGSASKVRVAMARTRSALDEYSSTTFRTACWSASDIGSTFPSSDIRSVQYSTMKFGAPLHTTRNFASSPSSMPPSHNAFRPETSLTVSIILREEENGTSNTRGYASATWAPRPIFWAATTIGASEELPRGSYRSSRVSSSVTFSSFVLQHRSAKSNAERTGNSSQALTIDPSRVTPPTVGSKPLPVTSYLMPPAQSPTMVILPSVKVPVLSLQITEADPSVSTAASFRTSTFFVTISLQPIEREMVTQSGMPSGIAATARVTAMRIMYSQLAPCGLAGSRRSMATPTMKIATQTTTAKTPMRAPKFSKFLCNGVALAELSGRQPQDFLPLPPSSPLISWAMRPMRVSMPVLVTMPRPLPLVTLQPEKTMFSGVSFSGSPSFFTLILLVFETSSGSPVSAISLTLTSSASTSRMSAGTTSPVPKTTRSPLTMVGTSTRTSWPPRITLMDACVIFDSASNESPAAFSVYAAIPALINTMRKIAIPVV